MISELKMRDEQLDGEMKVYISGEVDIYTSRMLKEKLGSLAENGQSDLTLECSELNYIDSAGLGILVGILKKIKQQGREIHIVGLKDNIKKLFTITGLDKLFSIAGE